MGKRCWTSYFHIGHNSFSSNFLVLRLGNLLHVPPILPITKNLLSVSQFCVNNNVVFEFHPNSYFVKDGTTKKNLLEGAVDEGLYKFNLIKNNASIDKANIEYQFP